MVNPASFVASARIRSIAYWSATVIIAAELALEGVWDVVRIEYVRDVLERQLGTSPRPRTERAKPVRSRSLLGRQVA